MKVYPPAGYCIYCGVKPNATEGLSKEHIIPEALGGRLILPDASCGKCRDATSKSELFVLRHMLGPTRAALDIRSSRRKDNPRPKFKAGILPEQNWYASGIEAPVEFREVELLPNVTVAKYGIPGFLRNASPSGDTTVHALGIMITPKDREQSLRGVRVQTSTPINHTVFFKMLAKIAHSYAVAELGGKTFQPFLTDIIRLDRPTG